MWPFLLTRILLPVSRHVARTTPGTPARAQALPPPLLGSNTPPPSTPSNHSRAQSALSMTAPSALPSPTSGQFRLPPTSSFSASGAGVAGSAAAVVKEAPGPASPGVFPLDVESWVHTTVPQLFRAAVSVVASNAQTAGPLGVPTLLGFFEPHICCRRRKSGGRSRASTLSSVGCPQAEQREAGSIAAAAEREKGEQMDSGDFGEPGLSLEGEMDAAAAAGAAVTEEAGVSGDGLMSRMALESVGLLVEGLAGQRQQVSPAVLAHICGSLDRMLHCCLPDSLDPVGRDAPGEDAADPGNADAGGSGSAGSRIAGARILFGGGDAGKEDAAGKASANGSTVAVSDGGENGENGEDGGAGAGPREEGERRRRSKASDLWPDVAAARGGSESTTEGEGVEEEEVSRSAEDIAEGRTSEGALLVRSDSLALSTGNEGEGDDGGGGVEFNGVRAAALLAAALRLQRLLYGLARLHLGQLGEDQTRVVMSGLSRGLRYARDFQGQHDLRASLFAAG